MNTHLLQLLDFSHTNSTSEVALHAAKVAEELIRNWKIAAFGREQAFLGLEFYVFIPEIHEDTAVHRREEQLSSGRFYFHTKSKAPKWSPPIFNRHGVDITCGNNVRGIYGGILIRHLGGEGNRDGSGVALRSLMRGDQGFKTLARTEANTNWSPSELELFKRYNNHSIFGGDIQLVYRPGHYAGEISSLERIGIEGKSHAHVPLRFIASTKR